MTKSPGSWPPPTAPDSKTLRDEFAMAFIPIIFESRVKQGAPWLDPETVAKNAYALADAMLARRNHQDA